MMQKLNVCVREYWTHDTKIANDRKASAMHKELTGPITQPWILLKCYLCNLLTPQILKPTKLFLYLVSDIIILFIELLLVLFEQVQLSLPSCSKFCLYWSTILYDILLYAYPCKMSPSELNWPYIHDNALYVTMSKQTQFLFKYNYYWWIINIVSRV